MVVQQFLERRGYDEVRGLSAPRTRGQGWIFVARPGVEEQLLMMGPSAMRVRQYIRRPRRYDEENVKQLRAQPWTRTREQEQQEKELREEKAVKEQQLIELGGDGDCGYRALGYASAAMVLRNDAKKLGTAFKTRAPQWLRRHDEWQKTYAKRMDGSRQVSIDFLGCALLFHRVAPASQVFSEAGAAA